MSRDAKRDVKWSIDRRQLTYKSLCQIQFDKLNAILSKQPCLHNLNLAYWLKWQKVYNDKCLQALQAKIGDYITCLSNGLTI